ncbi:MAG TPA: glycosyltransferase family 39 protein [Rubricoccaceae bacterium]|nr:glycosyltransferase family 39 protein [Rubricoccaceae bacterium]
MRTTGVALRQRAAALAARGPWLGVLRVAAGVLALAHVAVFVGVAALRIGYPYELEWIEGATLQHVERVQGGLPVYTAPGLAFTPLLYTPLYYAVGAGVEAVLGTGLSALRLVSLLATLAAAALVAALVRGEGAPRAVAAFAAGLFVASYAVGGAWYDLARVDALALALFLAFVYTARHARSGARYAVAGVLLALAFLTKQTTLAMGLPLVAYAFVTAGRRAWPMVASLAAGIGGAVLTLHLASGGWFGYYAFTLPGTHPWVPQAVFTFWAYDLARPFAVALLVAAVGLAGGAARGASVGWAAVFWASAVAAAWLSRLHDGGFTNVVIPAYAATAVLAGLGAGALLDEASQASPPRRARTEGALLFAGALQLLALAYDPTRLVPSPSDRAAADRLAARLRAEARPVFIPAHHALTARAGHPPLAHEMALDDVLRSATPEGAALRAELARAVRLGRWAYIVGDAETAVTLGLGQDYVLTDTLLTGSALAPVSGVDRRPRFGFRPAGPRRAAP